jgi:hypothetical protein
MKNPFRRQNQNLPDKKLNKKEKSLDIQGFFGWRIGGSNP